MKILDEVEFTIPCLPPSCNAIYQIMFRQRRVEMKPEVRGWKTKAKEYIPRIKPHEKLDYFKLDAVFHYPFFYQNGKVRKFDTQNLIKVLVDAVAEKIGFNDALVKFGSWESYHSDEDRVDCVLHQITLTV